MTNETKPTAGGTLFFALLLLCCLLGLALLSSSCSSRRERIKRREQSETLRQADSLIQLRISAIRRLELEDVERRDSTTRIIVDLDSLGRPRRLVLEETIRRAQGRKTTHQEQNTLDSVARRSVRLKENRENLNQIEKRDASPLLSPALWRWASVFVLSLVALVVVAWCFRRRG